MKGKLSVIVPVYNTEKYLRQCLDSIVNQTYKDLEVIIVDDGSLDYSGAICDDYAKKDGRITVIHKKNKGLADAWNDGIAQASGEWITFVDSDDWLELDYFESMFLGGVETIDILCAGGCYVNIVNGLQKMEKSFEKEFLLGPAEKEILLIKTLVRLPDQAGNRYRNLGFVWDKIYRRSFIKEKKLKFDTGYVAKCAWIDALFCFQAFMSANEVQGVASIGYHYREVADSSTKRYNKNLPKAYEAFFYKIYYELEDEKMDKRLLSAIYARTMEGWAAILNKKLFHPNNPQRPLEVYRELASIRTWPYFHDAIWSKDNTYLTKKQFYLKYILRIPSGRLLRFLWVIKKYRYVIR